jgi:hypothetical protein
MGWLSRYNDDSTYDESEGPYLGRTNRPVGRPKIRMVDVGSDSRNGPVRTYVDHSIRLDHMALGAAESRNDEPVA